MINSINVSNLTIGQVYTNLKLSMLQRGLLKSFIVDSVNSDGTFNVNLEFNDSVSSEIIMDSDAVIFEIDVE